MAERGRCDPAQLFKGFFIFRGDGVSGALKEFKSLLPLSADKAELLFKNIFRVDGAPCTEIIIGKSHHGCPVSCGVELRKRFRGAIQEMSFVYAGGCKAAFIPK